MRQRRPQKVDDRQTARALADAYDYINEVALNVNNGNPTGISTRFTMNPSSQSAPSTKLVYDELALKLNLTGGTLTGPVTGTIMNMTTDYQLNGSSIFSDGVFYINNTIDDTKILVLNNSQIDTATTRTITSPNYDFDFNLPVFNALLTVPTLNATSSIQLNGTSINTAGTLSNVAYLNQANPFTANQSINKDVATFSIIDSISRTPTLDFIIGTGDFGSDIFTDWRVQNTTGNLIFSYGASSTITEEMTLDSVGLKIGTGTASEALDVTGNIKASADIYSSGDTYWTGDGSGIPYGSCYGNEIAWAQAGAVQNTWYKISDADMSDGQLNLVTHDGSGKLTVTKAGRYKVDYSASAEVSSVNKHIQVGISVSGTEVSDGISHYEASVPNAQFHVASSAILDLAANAYIEISMRTTDTGTPDLAVDHLNIVITMVGGT